MVMVVTGVSLFIKDGRRRKVLVTLCEGEKRIDDIMRSTQFKSKSYVWELLRGLQKMRYVRKCGKGNAVYYKITDAGRKFLEKQSIEDVI
jgi:predicted transcriptional regulator